MSRMCFLICGFVLLVIPLVLYGQTGTKNLIRNGDFERFAGEDPAGWETTNIPKFCTVVSPSSRAHSGKLAVRCEVRDCSGTKFPGMITQKNIPIKGADYKMQCQYQLRVTGGDVGFISMEFKNVEGSTIRMCEEKLSENKPDYTLFTASFSAPGGATHAELRIALLATSKDGDLHEGSYILVDDVSLVEAGGTIPVQ